MQKLKWAPQKGKDYKNLPKKTLAVFDNTLYMASIKYDGNQIFISKDGTTVRFFTSDWKEFNLPGIGYVLSRFSYNFVLVAEMNYAGVGKLGERTVVQGKLTTERTRFKKGLPCALDESKVQIKCFDFIEYDSTGLMVQRKALDRQLCLNTLSHVFPPEVTVAVYELMSGAEARDRAKILINKGWEGMMLSEPDEYYYQTKRVNHVIKLKNRPTADLLCIGTELGEGKYANCIGALIMEDSEGRIVSVGSGLSDPERLKDPSYFIGKVHEIEYEQLMDTYQQPVYKCIRENKELS